MSEPLRVMHPQAKAHKKHNGLFVLACARGYLGDVCTPLLGSVQYLVTTQFTRSATYFRDLG